MDDAMELSVIVCTYNRAYRLIACLESIAAAIRQAALTQAEIVVIDNASTDNTSALVTDWGKQIDIPVNVYHESKQGLANARNCGLRSAKGRLLVMTDDDCHMDKNYLVDLLRHDASDQALVLRGGRVNLGDPADLPITIKTGNELKRWSLQQASARTQSLVHCVAGCNMAMRREVADKLGPFDPRFSSRVIFAGEDLDYLYRAYLAGVTLEYVPDMAVAHFHGRKTPQDAQKIYRNYMIGLGAVYAKYIFKSINLCRPGVWEARHALKDAVRFRNSFKPSLGISHMDNLRNIISGACRFYYLSLKGAPRA